MCVGLAYSPDGSRVAAGSFDHRVWIWDANSGDVVLKLQGHSDRVNRLAYSPDGKRLASSGYDLSVILWDTETGHQLLSFKPAGVAVAFTPDGQHRAIGSIDKGLKMSDGARKGLEILDATPLPEKP
jgi:WD40 repeat protein